MAILYVQEQGTKVRKRDNQLLVTKEHETLQAIPLTKVDQVVLMGRGAQLSTALLVNLLERGIPVTLTNEHGSRHYATLTNGPSRFGELRLQQMRLVEDPARALELARGFVVAKLSNQRTVLVAQGWNSARSAIAQITTAITSAQRTTTLDALRGFEGAGAAAYFGAWRAALPARWGFQGRAYYPPPDPLNAALSFGYTLATHEVHTALQITGLDPFLGVFHIAEAGRAALALDLVEEFRPLLVDALVLSLVRNGTLGPERFGQASNAQGGIHLTREGRALLVDHYQRRLQLPILLPGGERTALRRVMLLQAQLVVRIVRGAQAVYRGFVPQETL